MIRRGKTALGSLAPWALVGIVAWLMFGCQPRWSTDRVPPPERQEPDIVLTDEGIANLAPQDAASCEWEFCWAFYCTPFALCGEGQSGYTIAVQGEPGVYLFEIPVDGQPGYKQLVWVTVGENGEGSTAICRNTTGPYVARPLCDGWLGRQACCGQGCPTADDWYCE